MAIFQVSYDYQNQVRDLQNEMNQVLVQMPNILSLIASNGVATHIKHEWLEDVVTAQTWTVDGAYTSAGGTVTVDSTVGMATGDIVTYETSAGATIATTHKVTVTSGTEYTITPYGAGVSDADIGDNAIVKLVSRPRNEGTTASFTAGQEPTVEYNYCEIIDEAVKVSKTAQASKEYGIGNLMNYQVANAMKRMAYRLNNAVLHGKRVARTSSESGTMGGLLEFIGASTTGNVIDNSNGALTYDVINAALTTGVSLGATGLNTIICHPNQAVKISKFNNSVILTPRDDNTTGSSITSVLGGLGNIAKVVYDYTFPKDKVLIVDTSMLRLAYLRGTQDMDATSSESDDFVARRVLSELTLEVKNAKRSHVLITNVLL